MAEIDEILDELGYPSEYFDHNEKMLIWAAGKEIFLTYQFPDYYDEF